jgi:hypothetical protein
VGCDKTDWQSGEVGCCPIGEKHIVEEIITDWIQQKI